MGFSKWVVGSVALITGLAVIKVYAQVIQPQAQVPCYTSTNVADEDPHMNPSVGAVALDGESLLAFDAAWKAMLKVKLRPGQQKPDLRNFTVTFNQDKQNYYVHLVPRTSYTEQRDGSILLEIGGGNKYGHELRYTVSRKTMQITRVQTYR